MQIISLVGDPQLGKQVFEVVCQANGKTYLTTNESTARELLDKENGAPTKKDMHDVKINEQLRVIEILSNH